MVLGFETRDMWQQDLADSEEAFRSALEAVRQPDGRIRVSPMPSATPPARNGISVAMDRDTFAFQKIDNRREQISDDKSENRRCQKTFDHKIKANVKIRIVRKLTNRQRRSRRMMKADRASITARLSGEMEAEPEGAVVMPVRSGCEALLILDEAPRLSLLFPSSVFPGLRRDESNFGSHRWSSSENFHQVWLEKSDEQCFFAGDRGGSPAPVFFDERKLAKEISGQ
jgi:hypothetical protein